MAATAQPKINLSLRRLHSYDRPNRLYANSTLTVQYKAKPCCEGAQPLIILTISDPRLASIVVKITIAAQTDVAMCLLHVVIDVVGCELVDALPAPMDAAHRACNVVASGDFHAR